MVASFLVASSIVNTTTVGSIDIIKKNINVKSTENVVKTNSFGVLSSENTTTTINDIKTVTNSNINTSKNGLNSSKPKNNKEILPMHEVTSEEDLIKVIDMLKQVDSSKRYKSKFNKIISKETNRTKTIDELTFKMMSSRNIRETLWHILLVNSWNKLPDDINLSLDFVQGYYKLDERVLPQYNKMIQDLEKTKAYPAMISSYRDEEYQQELFDIEYQFYLYEGYDFVRAKEMAAMSTAIPGYSEHNFGFAVDIVDAEYQELDNKQEETKTQKWLLNNADKYGFICRYPKGKTMITGIIYEPWHYRYVGKPIAKYIKDNNLTLEEYVESLEKVFTDIPY